jgi:glycosyltransferase 2 family protein
VVVLFAFPSPVRSHMPVVTVALLAAGLGVALVGRARVRGGSPWWARASLEGHGGLFARRTWVCVVLASGFVVAGHLATFVIAARAAGSTAPVTLLLPLALLALLAMGVPLSVAGWGPREGVAAWAFGAAGLTATQGVSTAVTYGVLVLVATLPGAGVLLLRSLHALSARFGTT